jgi:hypothetical protein
LFGNNSQILIGIQRKLFKKTLHYIIIFLKIEINWWVTIEPEVAIATPEWPSGVAFQGWCHHPWWKKKSVVFTPRTNYSFNFLEE